MDHFRHYSRNQRRYPQPQMIRAHFENIRMLASIIQDSQSLIMQERMMPQYPPRMPTTASSPTYVVPFDSLLPHINPTRESFDISYTTQTIDASNTPILPNTSIVHFQEYRMISEPLNEMCPITRESFFLNQQVSMIRTCKHIFNKEALRIWLQSNRTCPTCRASIYS